MKIVTILTLLLCSLTIPTTLGTGNLIITPKQIKKIETVEKPIDEINTNGQIDNLDELIEALIWVESRGNENAIGDTHLDEPSVGVLQLRPIMVREVNRILKQKGSDKRFKLKDRKSREKSIEMFTIWYNTYHKDSSFEKAARNWNGGPNGWKKESTQSYWDKVSSYANKNL